MNLTIRHENGDMRYSLGSGVLERLPEHAKLVGQTAADWAAIEAIFSGCLATIMTADLVPTIALLKRFGTATAKAQAAREIGKSMISERERMSFLQMVQEFEALAKRRNDVVHAVWATSDDHPGELLSVEGAVLSTLSLRLICDQLLGRPVSKAFDDLRTTIVPLEELQRLVDDIKAFDKTIMPILNDGLKSFARREVQLGRLADGITLSEDGDKMHSGPRKT